MQSAVILIHRSHLQPKTFKLQQTEMVRIMVLKTKLIVNHPLWQLQDKASQVINQLSPSVPHEYNMIAETITDFAFALIKAISIVFYYDSLQEQQ